MAHWPFFPSKSAGGLRRTAVLAGLLGIAPAGLIVPGPAAAAASVPTPQVLYVATGGSNAGNTCAAPSRPCQAIQYAISQAESGLYKGAAVAVLIADGTYSENDTIGAGDLQSLVIEPYSATGKVTVKGSGKNSVFLIEGGIVGLAHLTITGGDGVIGGGVYIKPRANVILLDDAVVGNAAGGLGGGVANFGDATLTNGSISNNTVGYTADAGSSIGSGGGLYNDATARLTNVSITGNTSVNGNGGGVANVGEVSLNQGSISYNTIGTEPVTKYTVGSGGGLFNQATANLTGVSITGNTTVDSNGGGVYNSGKAVLAAGTVSGNRALKGTGGGIYDKAGTTTGTPGTRVYGNSPDNCVPSWICVG